MWCGAPLWSQHSGSWAWTTQGAPIKTKTTKGCSRSRKPHCYCPAHWHQDKPASFSLWWDPVSTAMPTQRLALSPSQVQFRDKAVRFGLILSFGVFLCLTLLSSVVKRGGFRELSLLCRAHFCSWAQNGPQKGQGRDQCSPVSLQQGYVSRNMFLDAFLIVWTTQCVLPQA